MEITQEIYDIAIQAAFDKGRYSTPTMWEAIRDNYFKRMEENAKFNKARQEIELMNLDEIGRLTDELKQVKDKYIKLFELYHNTNKPLNSI